jgi:serine protease Do
MKRLSIFIFLGVLLACSLAAQDISTSRRSAITRAVGIGSPATVGINVVEVRDYQVRDPFADFFNDPFFGMYFQHRAQQPQTYRQEVAGLGSGFLVSPDGYILTNDHVAGHATKIVVTLTNGEKYTAKLIGTDRTSDVALLKIEDESVGRGTVFPYLKFANSDEIIIGEWAIGNPFGLFDVNAKPTVTVGVVSNAGINMAQEGRVYRGMIQTDAAISSGNSGGPLLNSLGEVIAMNTIIYSTAQSGSGAGSIGIGFAIPVNRVRKVMDLLKRDGSIDRDFNVGLRVQQVDERIAKYLDLKKVQGVVVSEIAQNSPADKAGFEPGDIILEIDGQKIRRENDVQTQIFDGVTGQTLTLQIARGDKIMQKQLTLERRKK